jgi:all-trans-retinol 13,14-reductase
MDLTDSSLIRGAYRKRLRSLENSVSSFTVNIVLKKDSFPYTRSNYYYHRRGHVWDMADYSQDNWPLGYVLFSTPSRSNPKYASSVTLITYMRFEEVYPWKDSFNTVSDQRTRGHEYDEFKRKKTEKLLQLVEERFPGIRNCIQANFASTPLSYRDYLGTEDGSMYGIVKDYHDPVRSMIPARTKLPNLFLTGQNLNLHGILGTAISSLVTCTQLLGDDAFIDKIRNA